MNHFEASLLHYAGESTDLKRYLDRQVEVFVDQIGRDASAPARILHVGAHSPTLLLGLARQGHTVYAAAQLEQFHNVPPAIAQELADRVSWVELAAAPACAPFDVVTAANNALADCLTETALQQTLCTFGRLLAPGGRLLANVRNYDLLLQTRARQDGMQIFATACGQCIYFATLAWEGRECAYTANRYLIAQRGRDVRVEYATTSHRAWRFAEINMALLRAGFVASQRQPLDDDRMLLSAHKGERVASG